MKTARRLLALGWIFSCLGSSAQELLPDALPESPLLPPLPEAEATAPFAEIARPKIAVFEAEISVDGQPRRDLGRAVTDALIAGFLRSGTVDVIDISGKNADGRASSPAELGREAVCDRVYVPAIFSQGGGHRMSVRQLAIPSGKVEHIYEDKARGPESELFALVERMGARLSPAPAPPPPAPRRSGPIRAWMSGPADTERALTEAPRALTPAQPAAPVRPRPRPAASPAPPSSPLKTIVFAGNRRVEIEEIGRIAAHNADYSFCVLTLNKGRQLNSGDRVLLKIDDPARPTLTGTVTRRVEGTSVIVQYSAEKPPVFPKDARAYQWVPEAETQPSPGLPAVPETTPLY